MTYSYIKALLNASMEKGIIDTQDAVYCENLLLSLFNIVPSEPDMKSCPSEITDILDCLCDCAVQASIIQDTLTQRDNFSAKIMGLLTPFPSFVTQNFMRDFEISPKLATDRFYKLSQDVNYIQTARIKKNLYWLGASKYGDLEITVNLSKPEKDPKDIAAAKNAVQSNYPKCLLCLENVGFEGNLNHPARQNHRVIPMNLSGEQWFFQYSPYVYYNEHCIVFNKEHTPMKLTKQTFERLVSFVDFLPHYFIGSNADLPIVGGSILTHDHFQGGRHVFPMELAPDYKTFMVNGFDDVSVSLVKWPMSVIRLRQKDKSKRHTDIIELSNHLLEKWREYSDESLGIYSHTGDTPHNTVTPIVRYNRTGFLEIDLVLRNNRTSDEHPLGIFHPHANLHHIKKENIGLIEVMGLAVLPGRLDNSLKDLSRVLTGEWKLDEIPNELNIHKTWLEGIYDRCGHNHSPYEAMDILKAEVALVFEQVLEDAGVFKQNKEGLEGFERFFF